MWYMFNKTFTFFTFNVIIMIITYYMRQFLLILKFLVKLLMRVRLFFRNIVILFWNLCFLLITKVYRLNILLFYNITQHFFQRVISEHTTAVWLTNLWFLRGIWFDLLSFSKVDVIFDLVLGCYIVLFLYFIVLIWSWFHFLILTFNLGFNRNFIFLIKI